MSRVKYEDEQGVKNIHTRKTLLRFSFSAASAHFLVLLSFALFVASLSFFFLSLSLLHFAQAFFLPLHTKTILAYPKTTSLCFFIAIGSHPH